MQPVAAPHLPRLPSHLLNAVSTTEEGWEDETFNNMQDSWGQVARAAGRSFPAQEWTFSQRRVLENTCQGAHFLTIVQVQWADLLISKTRMLSIFQQVGAASVHNPLCYQGMNNKVLNFGLFFETFCAALILYFPYSYIVNLYPVAPEWWLSALPFTLLIWGSDEVGGPGLGPVQHPAVPSSIHNTLLYSSYGPI